MTDMAKIKIDGVSYEFPSLDTLTLDESIMLERYAGKGIETLIPGDELPIGAIKALICIAIMRAQPNRTEREIAEYIGQMKITELGQIWEEREAEPDAGPPEVLPGESESTEPSGSAGNTASEFSPEQSLPGSSGSQDSDRSASVRRISAA